MSMIPRVGVPGGVPDTFAPEFIENELPMADASSPDVQPMRNQMPDELGEFANALGNFGTTAIQIGNTIGDRVQETMDDAATKAAENQFLQSSFQTLATYKQTQGINAVQQFEPAAQAISKARDDAAKTLTNPVQQRMFGQLSNEHLLTFGQQMADHQATQQVEYGKEQSNARADLQFGMAQAAYLHGDMAGYARYRAAATAEAGNLAGLNGLAPDSDAAQAMLNQKQGQMVQGIVAGLHDRNAIAEEEQFFNDESGNLDMRTREMIGNMVHQDVRQRAAITDGKNAILAAKGLGGGPGDLQPPIPAATITTTDGIDGIDIHAAPGTNVHAPESGTVSKVWTDPQLGNSAQISLPNGYTATFNGLAAINYKEGQKITQGQVLGQTGTDDAGQGVMHYGMTDGDGAAIDPRQAASAPFDPRSFSSPNDEEAAVNWINSNISDPEEQRSAERYVRGIANMNRQIDNQEHSAALKQATDYSLQNNGSLQGLPASVMSQLTPEDVDGFNQQAKAKNDVNLLASWIENPQSMTVDAVRQAYAQGRLSDQGYLTSLRQAQSLQGGDTSSTDPNKVRAVTVDHDQLTDILAVNQLPNLAEPKTPADKLARVELETAVKQEIDAQQQQGNRTLSWQEKGKIARDMVIDKVYTSGMWGTNSGLKPVATLTPEEMDRATVWIGNQSVRLKDIPPTATVRAMQELDAAGAPTTQANIAAWWLKSGRPSK